MIADLHTHTHKCHKSAFISCGNTSPEIGKKSGLQKLSIPLVTMYHGSTYVLPFCIDDINYQNYSTLIFHDILTAVHLML